MERSHNVCPFSVEMEVLSHESLLTCLLIYSLTGLLSFMLSDEMTAGSVNASDAHKQAFALRSHSWNLTQSRFKDAFPDVSIPPCLRLLHRAAFRSYKNR